MRSFSTTDPLYIPKVGDNIEVIVPESSRSIYGKVVHKWGSNAQGKINILCKAGPKSAGFHLIWKESTGWFCWIVNAHYHNLQVIKDDGPPRFDPKI